MPTSKNLYKAANEYQQIIYRLIYFSRKLFKTITKFIYLSYQLISTD